MNHTDKMMKKFFKIFFQDFNFQFIEKLRNYLYIIEKNDFLKKKKLLK